MALRVLVCVTRGPQPLWVHRWVDALRDAPFVALVGVDASGDRLRLGVGARLWRGLDRLGFGSQAAGMEPEGALDREGIGLDQASDSDVVLWLRGNRPDPQTAVAPTRGVWAWTYPAGSAGPWREVGRLAGHASSVLRRFGADVTADEKLGEVVVAADRRSVLRTLSALRTLEWRVLLARLKRESDHITAPTVPAVDGASGPPGLVATASSLARIVARFIQDRLEDRRSQSQWQLAWRRGGDLTNGPNMTPIVPPQDRYWADPFPIRRQDRDWVFFEEVAYGRPGTLAVGVLRGDLFEYVGTVLEGPHHLSWPFLFEWEENLFLLPESRAAGRIEAFRCVDFPLRWEPYAVLLERPAVDPVLVEHEGRWWLFCTVASPGVDAWDTLYLFYADHPFGPFRPHPGNPVVSDVRNARAAGRIERTAAGLIRPAQDW